MKYFLLIFSLFIISCNDVNIVNTYDEFNDEFNRELNILLTKEAKDAQYEGDGRVESLGSFSDSDSFEATSL